MVPAINITSEYYSSSSLSVLTDYSVLAPYSTYWSDYVHQANSSINFTISFSGQYQLTDVFVYPYRNITYSPSEYLVYTSLGGDLLAHRVIPGKTIYDHYNSSLSVPHAYRSLYFVLRKKNVGELRVFRVLFKGHFLPTNDGKIIKYR